MKKLIILAFLGFTYIYSQQTVKTKCVFYLGAVNTLDCLGLKPPYKANFTVDNGTITANFNYKPASTGTANIRYESKIYNVLVQDLPNPNITLEGHLKDSNINIDEIHNGIRVVPFMQDFPFAVYITMRSVEFEFLDYKKTTCYSFKAVDENLIRISDDELKNPKCLKIRFLKITSVGFGLDGGIEKKLNCNIIYRINL